MNVRPSSRAVLLLIAAGLAGTVAATAQAQTPRVINLSGATLFDNFFAAPASTNDYIDADKNGVAGRTISGVQQLSVSTTPIFPYPAGSYWAVQYRGTGSLNGFKELLGFGQSFSTGNSSAGTNELRLDFASNLRYNRLNMLAAPNNALQNSGNPSSWPLRSDTVSLLGTYAAPNNASAGGARIDIAPSDVPSFWIAQIPGSGSPPFDAPGQAGYGTHARASVNASGTGAGAGQDYRLPSLTSGATTYNLYTGVPAQANANTLFDSPVASVPVAVLTNFGTGMTSIRMTEMQHLMTTGRLPSGENLTMVTRDVGSGTHNIFANAQGVDPSYAVGENIGLETTDNAKNLVGANYQPGNKGGSGQMENTVRNTRLGIGYSGAERGINNGWLATNRLELLGIINDANGYGGVSAVRPTLSNILHNAPATGYQLIGLETFITVGDPKGESVADGGLGLTTPKLRNPHAAAYVNNITQSIAAFNADPGSDQTVFMPGEFLAANFVLASATDFVHPASSPRTLVSNPTFNQSLQDYIFAQIPASVYTNSKYASFALNGTGNVPQRTTGVVYSDGVAGGANYINQAGAAVSYNADLALRNKFAYDFNGDGQRTPADIADMLRAFRQRNGGPAWTAPDGSGLTQAQGGISGALGTTAVIEILGDGNNDGTFNRADVRYAADGLFMYNGTYGIVAGSDGADALNGLHVDRKQAFTAVDNEWFTLTGSLNFFNTMLATGTAYTAGASRADISGAAGTTPGYAPVGSDGAVNAADLDYILKQFVASRNPALPDRPGNHVPAGGANWTVLSQATWVDLSADMTGDLIIDQNDVNEVLAILNTVVGDYNLDGVYDQADRDVLAAHFGQPGWANGDSNGDGVANVYDLPCKLDYNLDGSLNPDDLGDFITDYFTQSPSVAGPAGYAFPCPGQSPPYNVGWKANYTISNEPQCFEPNPDNLGDYITDYFGAAC